MKDYFGKEDPADWVARKGDMYEMDREVHATLKMNYAKFVVRTHRADQVRAFDVGRRAPQAAEEQAAEEEEFHSAGSHHEEEE